MSPSSSGLKRKQATNQHGAAGKQNPAGSDYTALYHRRQKPLSLVVTCDHFRMDVTWFEVFLMPLQSFNLTFPVTPMVPMLALTPPKYAVALQAESATWLSTQ
jgi:hypothetical protein